MRAALEMIFIAHEELKKHVAEAEVWVEFHLN